MEIKSDSEIIEEITREYNKDPEGNWRVVAFEGEKSRYDLYVVKGKRSWQIKTEFITPHKYISVGGRATTKEVESDYTFGLRPLPRQHVKKIIRHAKKGGISEDLFREIMKIPPVPTTEASEESRVLQGPMILSPFMDISPLQKKLDKNLSRELDRLLFREQVGSIYR